MLLEEERKPSRETSYRGAKPKREGQRHVMKHAKYILCQVSLESPFIRAYRLKPTAELSLSIYSIALSVNFALHISSGVRGTRSSYPYHEKH
jgi:hypothetical protein